MNAVRAWWQEWSELVGLVCLWIVTGSAVAFFLVGGF